MHIFPKEVKPGTGTGLCTLMFIALFIVANR